VTDRGTASSRGVSVLRTSVLGRSSWRTMRCRWLRHDTDAMRGAPWDSSPRRRPEQADGSPPVMADEEVGLNTRVLLVRDGDTILSGQD
jgi:hypothetical protein